MEISVSEQSDAKKNKTGTFEINGFSQIEKSWLRFRRENKKLQSRTNMRSNIKKQNDFIFGKILLSAFWCNKQNWQFFNGIVCHNLNSFDWDCDGRNRTDSYVEKKLANGDFSKLMVLSSHYPTLKHLTQVTQLKIFR